MSTDAHAQRLRVEPQPPGNRRAFVRRAALAATGAVVATPALGGATARAAGSLPAYTDAENTFTQTQRFSAPVGIGVSSPSSPLHVRRTDAGWAAKIDAYWNGLQITQTNDWAGATHDVVDLTLRSTGDGVFVAHQGGKPPGYSGVIGGNAAFNALIPYYIDDGGDGRGGAGGTTVNNRTGMRGLFIETQPPNSGVRAIEVNHWGNDYAVYIQSQSTRYPQGVGGSLWIDDSSSLSAVKIYKRSIPNSSEAILNLVGANPSPMTALLVRDGASASRARVKTDGTTDLGDAHLSWGARLNVDRSGPGLTVPVSLTNFDANGAGVRIQFADHAAQYAFLDATFDRTSAPRDGALRLSVLSGGTMRERLKLNKDGIGFFGATPAARPTVSGSRGGNQALAGLLTALAGLGLITDGTSA